MKKAKKRGWLPPAKLPLLDHVKRTRQMRDGEPRTYPLTRWPNDRTLLTDATISCCDCGLTHHTIFNVLRAPDGSFHLLMRAFRLPTPALRKRSHSNARGKRGGKR